MHAYVLKTIDCLYASRLRVLAVAVLAVSCGGGTLEAPPQSPDPPSVAVETAPAEAAAVETASVKGAAVETTPAEDAVVDSTAAEVPTTSMAAAAVVDSEAPATAAAAPSTAKPAAVSEPPIETTAPFTTIAERAVIRTNESVIASALEAMLRDLQPRRVVLASVFYATNERAIADFCIEEPSGDGFSHRHVQRGVDLRATRWKIVSAFDIRVVDDLESCVASFD